MKYRSGNLYALLAALLWGSATAVVKNTQF